MAVLLLAAACSDSGESDEDSSPVSAESVDAGVASEPATRERAQVVVIGADAESVDAIRAALFDYDLDEALEQVVIVGAPSCQPQTGDLIECQSDPQPRDESSGRWVMVVLDDAFVAAAEAVDTTGGPPNILISGEPNGAANELASLGPALTFVPGGLSELVADPVVTFLVAVNDAFAAFVPVTVGDDLVALRADRFFDARLQEMALEVETTVDANEVIPVPEVRWVLDLPEPRSTCCIHERAIVVDDIVAFLGSDGLARGLDADDGTVLWSKELETDPGGNISSFVAATGNTFLVSSGGQGRNLDPDPDLPERSLWALDVRTGDVFWVKSVSAAGAIGHPATDGERVFAWIAEDDTDISLRAFDIIDGDEIWRTEGSMGFGPPRVDLGEVWTGSEDGALRGFDAETGMELARFDEIALGVAGVASRPAVTDDQVYFGNDNGTFYAIDRVSGELVWSFATESANLPSSPVIAGDIVVFGSFDASVYGLDIVTGALLWRCVSEEVTGLFLSSPALAGETVYIGSFAEDGSLIALDAQSGEPVWELPWSGQTGASPFVDGETVYIQSPEKFWAVAR